jgi:nucleotide-binding universal stress UspA family protein
MRKITVYIDGSVYAESVCDHAVWAAERLRLPIQVVHVLGRRSDTSSRPADLSGSLRLGARSSLLEELARHDEERARLVRARGRALLDDAAARIASRGDVEVTTRLRHGDFLDAIGEMEDETRFAILGKRGEAADFATMHLGSNLDRAVRATNGGRFWWPRAPSARCGASCSPMTARRARSARWSGCARARSSTGSRRMS